MVAPHTEKQRVARAEVTQHKHTPSVHYTLLWIRISKACDLHYLLFYFFIFFIDGFLFCFSTCSGLLHGGKYYFLDKKKKILQTRDRGEHFPAERTPFNFSHQGRYFRTFAPPSKASSDCDGGAEQT